MSSEIEEIVSWFGQNRNTKNTDSMARFGINSSNAYGIPLPMLRAKAKEYKKRHRLALELWDTGIHEARVMASMVADPQQFTPELMDSWVADFDSWDVCDQCCSNLFRLTPFAHDKVWAYAVDERKFVRRTAFVLIAVLAVHDKQSGNDVFMKYLTLIEDYAFDGRNFVKKAVNWALRQIGKRNIALNSAAAKTAAVLAASTLPPTRWTGKDALRELTSQKTLDYIRDHRKNMTD